MTAKELLAKRVPTLTEEEAQRVLLALDAPAPPTNDEEREHGDPMIAAFREAPEDDEPWTEQDEAAMAEVRADEAAGVPTIPLQEIKAKYRLS